ncbi:hypothetical protein ABBQ38_008564 [Trebouxia sp. C0009 RCD-2024]
MCRLTDQQRCRGHARGHEHYCCASVLIYRRAVSTAKLIGVSELTSKADLCCLTDQQRCLQHSSHYVALLFHQGCFPKQADSNIVPTTTTPIDICLSYTTCAATVDVQQSSHRTAWLFQQGCSPKQADSNIVRPQLHL